MAALLARVGRSRSGSLLSFWDLIELNDTEFYGESRKYNYYSQARYLFYYLQESGG